MGWQDDPVAPAAIAPWEKDPIAPPVASNNWTPPFAVQPSGTVRGPESSAYGVPGFTQPKLGLTEPLIGEPITRPPQSFLEGAANSLQQGAASLTSPLNLALLPIMAPEVAGATIASIARPVIAGLFGGLGAKTIGQSLGTLAGTPNPIPGQYGQAVGDVAQGALMTLGPVAHMVAHDPIVEPPSYDTSHALKDLPSVIADLRSTLVNHQISPVPTETPSRSATLPPIPGSVAGDVFPLPAAPVIDQPPQQPVPVEEHNVLPQPSTGPVGKVQPQPGMANMIANLRNLVQVSGFNFGRQGVLAEEAAREPSAPQVPYVPIRPPDIGHHVPGTQQQQQPEDVQPSSMEEAPTTAPQSGVAPVKTGTAPETMFLHDLNGLNSLISGAEQLGRLTKDEAVAFRKRADEAFNYLSDTGDLKTANAAIGGIRKAVGEMSFPPDKPAFKTVGPKEPESSPVLSPTMEQVREKPLPRVTPEELAKAQASTEKGLLPKDMTPEEIPDIPQLPLDNPIQLQGPRLASQPQDLGFKVSPEDRVDPGQLYNRLRNITQTGKLAPAEFDVYDKAGLREFLDTKPTMGEVGEWMKERGPRIEVHDYGMEGKVSAAKQEYDKMTHEWYDNLPANLKDEIRLNSAKLTEKNTKAWGDARASGGFGDRLLKYLQLKDEVVNEPKDTSPHATTAYKSVSPFDTTKYPVKRVDVVVPETQVAKERATQRGERFYNTQDQKGVARPPDFIHEQLTNTLGWAMMQYKDVGGEKVGFIGEVQSKWGQAHREAYKKDEGGGRPILQRGHDVVPNHPLLRDYNRLILKATIAQALRDGAKRVVVTDSKTTMMTELLDQYNQMKGPYDSKEAAMGGVNAAGNSELKPFEHGSKWYLSDKQGGFDFNYGPTFLDKTGKEQPSQLPQIMEELTGVKGEKVDMGEHKNAFEGKFTGDVANRFNVRNEQGQPVDSFSTEAKAQEFIDKWKQKGRNLRMEDANKPRQNLIFRNPDNTLKTHATGLSYDLSKVDARKEPYSLMGRDKMGGAASQAPMTFDQGKAKETVYNQEALDRLKLPTSNPSVHDALNAITKDPVFFGKSNAGLAEFLTKNFGSVLKVTKLSPDGGIIGRTHYHPYEEGGPTVHLSLGDNEASVPTKIMHEAAHAATWWAFEHPRSAAQFAAVDAMKEIRALAVKALTADEKKFLYDKMIPSVQGSLEKGTALSYMDDFLKSGIPLERSNLLYALSNDSEFIAGVISDQGVRRFLNSVEYQGKSAIARAWDGIKSLLGIAKDTLADRAFDALKAAGEAPRSEERAIGASGKDTIAQAPAPGPAVVRDMNRDEFLRHKGAYLSGWSAPRSVAVSWDLGNKLVSYASSRIAAPVVARSLATQVLGTKYKDANFNKLLGSVIVEDQLRGVKKGFMDTAAATTDPIKKQELIGKGNVVTTLVGQPYSPFRNEADYQRILNHPDMLAAVDRHKDLIMPIAERAHVELGGKLAQGGEQTGAFANLLAITSPDDIESARSMIYGSRRGDITNQLRKGSAFSKERKGTAWMYDTDYRKIAERMIRGNWEQKRLRDLISQYEAEGVGYEQKAGMLAPTTVKGERLVPKTIELRGSGPGMTRHIKLWLRSDLAPELEQALQSDSPIRRAGVGLLIDAVNDLQIAGPTDAAWHTANMFAAIGSSQGGGNLLADLARKIPGIQQADALGRVVMAARDVLLDHPEVQKELAQIAEVGAGRSPAIHGSLVSKGLKAIGVEKLDPSFWTSKFIQFMDKSGRVVLNRMYDNLVDRKMAEDSDLARREFVNKMGQYNRRLSGYWTNLFKDAGIAPFVTAGKNFNRLAMQKVLMSPGAVSLNPRAAWKMRAVEAAGALMALYVFPTAINYMLHGSKGARSGVPVGAIDTGKDDANGRPIVIDPLQTMLYRRGIRITGGAALDTAAREKLGRKETLEEMTKAIVDGQLRPWEGPVPRAAVTAKTGYDTSGYLQSRNPNDMGENVKAALEQINPFWAAFMGTAQEGKLGGAKGLGLQLGGAIGLKEGRYPSMQEKTDAEIAKLGHEPSLGERALITHRLQQEKEPNANELLQRKSSVDALWKDFARQDRLKEALPKEQQAWLDANKLHITGFQAELSESGIKIPMSRAEGDKMEGLFAAWYAKGVANVMKNPGFAGGSPHMKQVILDKTLDEYRKVARQVWEARAAKGK